jgi:hypothetical protein
LYYVISDTLQAHGEFTRVNDEDMMVLAKAAIQNCKLMANLGAIILLYLKHQALQSCRSIVCAGVITVIANTLNVHVCNMQTLQGEIHVVYSTLNACGMLTKIKGRCFVHIPGVGHLTLLLFLTIYY